MMREELTAKELDRQFRERCARDGRVPELHSLRECEMYRHHGYDGKQRERREST